MTDLNQLSQLKMDQKTTLKATDIHVHDFRIDARERTATSDNILDQITKAARQTSQSQSASSLRVNAIDMGFDGLRAQLGDDEPQDILLREAKSLVHEQKHEQALGKIGEIFDLVEHHHEAKYLQAYCYCQLDRIDHSLKVLCQLDDALLTNRLKTCVISLREEIRQTTVPRAAKIYQEAVRSKQTSKAIPALTTFAQSDPRAGKFHVFLVGALLIAKDVSRARDAVITGLDSSDDANDELRKLLNSIDIRFIPKWLSPARNSYRIRNYREASRQLDEVADKASSNPLWITFHKFMEEYNEKKGGLFSRLLSGGVKTHDAPGPMNERNELYEYLVKPEMTAARKAVTANNFEVAEKALTAAVGHTPFYSQPNHMLATCVYQRVGKVVKLRVGKDLDEAGAKELKQCQKQLDAALGFAKIGCRDPGIKDAQQVAQSIGEMQKEIGRVLSKYEDQVHDAKIVNSTIEELLKVFTDVSAIMSTNDPARQRSGVLSLYSTLSRVRNSLTSLRSQCRGDEARGLVDMIRNNFVEPLYTQLNGAIKR